MIAGLIGYGNIGKELAKFLEKSDFFELKYICDIVDVGSRGVSFNELVEKSELIIEAANGEAAKKILESNLIDKKIIVMSTGGLVGVDLSKLKSEIYLPSGAIAGIDALKAVASEIDTIKLITTKSPQSLEGAPYVIENNLDLNFIVEKKTIFKGNLLEAIKGFPKNVNVAATISLAVNKNIEVEVVVDPEIKTNTHRILCNGSFGKLDLLIENKPSNNPKTSYLAVLSAIQTLKNIENRVKIGS